MSRTVLSRQIITASAFAVYVGAIIFANYLIVHGCPGAAATPFGTYTLPVGLGLVAPAGTYMAAITFPMRDLVQRSGGRTVGLIAIFVAGFVSWWVSSPTIAVASGVTFIISETCDFVVYTPLQKKWFVSAVVVSGVLASVVDSLIFLQLAHIPYSGNLAGLIVGKIWIVTLIGGPLAWVLRKKLSLQKR